MKKWGRTPFLRRVAASYGRKGRAHPISRQRLVVVDVESSGFNPLHDRLISVGAVAVRDGLVHLNDSFDVVLRQERPSAEHNILVHGIGGTAQLAGREAASALRAFLAYAGKDPLVAFHADFDRALIERATAAALGVKPGNVWLDLALIVPALIPAQPPAARSLDDWLQRFGIENYARHDALADAMATAQLTLVVLSAAAAARSDSLSGLIALQRAQRWLAFST